MIGFHVAFITKHADSKGLQQTLSSYQTICKTNNAQHLIFRFGSIDMIWVTGLMKRVVMRIKREFHPINSDSYSQASSSKTTARLQTTASRFVSILDVSMTQ